MSGIVCSIKSSSISFFKALFKLPEICFSPNSSEIFFEKERQRLIFQVLPNILFAFLTLALIHDLTLASILVLRLTFALYPTPSLALIPSLAPTFAQTFAPILTLASSLALKHNQISTLALALTLKYGID